MRRQLRDPADGAGRLQLALGRLPTLDLANPVGRHAPAKGER
jgi:hypothetical protein